jgi:hypothetical protein
MIENIKIFGERNSGTNFLATILKDNIIDETISFKPGGENIWKHGHPEFKLFENVIDTTLFIFIIRDKESWLKSMYNIPYHYNTPTDINKFLQDPLEVEENLFTDEREKLNVIDLRYSKINSYLSFFKLVKNAIIINLSDLQERTKKFLSFIEDYYKIRMKQKFYIVETHLKDSTLKVQNRTYDTVLPQNIKNNAILEDFVQKLKQCYYCKRSIRIEKLKPWFQH